MINFLMLLYWHQRQSGIILCMSPANERRRYIVTSSPIGWAHTQNDPWAIIRFWSNPNRSVWIRATFFRTIFPYAVMIWKRFPHRSFVRECTNVIRRFDVVSFVSLAKLLKQSCSQWFYTKWRSSLMIRHILHYIYCKCCMLLLTTKYLSNILCSCQIVSCIVSFIITSKYVMQIIMMMMIIRA